MRARRRGCLRPSCDLSLLVRPGHAARAHRLVCLAAVATGRERGLHPRATGGSRTNGAGRPTPDRRPRRSRRRTASGLRLGFLKGLGERPPRRWPPRSAPRRPSSTTASLDQLLDRPPRRWPRSIGLGDRLGDAASAIGLGHDLGGDGLGQGLALGLLLGARLGARPRPTWPRRPRPAARPARRSRGRRPTRPRPSPRSA